jgi:putative tricarboxylic transport membrane protein
VEGIFSVAIIIISLIYVGTALHLPFGSIDNPGPGFFPMIAGTLVIVLTIIHLITKRSEISFKIPGFKLSNFIRGKLLQYIIAMGLYTAVLGRIGFEIDTFLLGFALMKISGVKGWVKPIVISILVVLVNYLVFVRWLGIALP